MAALDRAGPFPDDGDMRLSFLGTGTSHGIPVVGCDCAVCRSPDPRNRRLRASVLVESATTKLLVDTPPDFRQQALRAGLRRVDGVLLTHTHADHFLGLDDLRVFTGETGPRLSIYGSVDSVADLGRVFPYALAEDCPWAGVPRFVARPIAPFEEVNVGDLEWQAVPVRHGYMTVFGFIFNRQVAYVTDCSEVTPDTCALLRGVPVLVLDALRRRPHPTHLTLAGALDVAGQVGAKLTLFTHLCHEMDHEQTEAELPANVRLAFDGMQVEVRNGELTVTGNPFGTAGCL